MTRAALAVALAALGCTRVEYSVRTERGPLTRSFSRTEVLPGPARAHVRVAWPALEVNVVEHDVCRALTFDEYLEERITERSVPAAGPALSMGVAGALGGAALFGFSFLASAAPDTSLIDTAGRYGAPPRVMMQGASVVALVLAVPALVVAGIGYLRTGEDVEQRRVELETGQRDAECHTREPSGPLRVMGPAGEVGVVMLTAGVGRIDAAQLRGPVEGLAIGDREVQFDEAGAQTLLAFDACVRLEAEGSRAPESLSDVALSNRVERARACRHVRPDVSQGPLAALEAELVKRRSTGSPGAFPVGPQVGSFEDALAAYAPRLSFKAGAADVAKLDAPDALNGQAVLLLGVVSQALAENIGVVQVGERELFVFMPPKRAWGGDFPNGTRVEAIAVMAGWQTVGEKTLPLARLVWMRPSF